MLKTNSITLTQRERDYLTALSHDFNYVCRDEDGLLIFSFIKPCKSDVDFWGVVGITLEFGFPLFDFIKWEDEEPYKISDLIGGEK